MLPKKQIVAFSGGKDSTAMVLKMWENGENFECLFTPAGNEPKALFDHIDLIMSITGKELIQLQAPTLFSLIEHFRALPNHRQRWCTRMIKIMPCIAYLQNNPGSTLCIGFRGDEESREGLYGNYTEYRYPLQEWSWGIKEVNNYLQSCGINIPQRTNCMLCYGQRLSEWYDLYRDNIKQYKIGIDLEEKTGRTFRSPSRDTWPASMLEMSKLFKQGKRPQQSDDQLDMWGEKNYTPCRICTI